MPIKNVEKYFFRMLRANYLMTMDYYQLPELKKRKELFRAFSTKEAGNFVAGSKVDDEAVKKRANWLKQFDIDFAKVITLPLTGGSDVLVIKSRDQKFSKKFDSAITKIKDIYFVMIIADCLPVIIYDPKVEVLGFAHAGWRGINGNILGKTIDEMVKTYGVLPQDLIVGIGPAIHKDSYIRDKTFREEISAELNKFVFDFGKDKVKVDLISAAVDQLVSCGIDRNNIELSGQDTFSKNYFSHHRSALKKELDGRNMAVVGMRS